MVSLPNNLKNNDIEYTTLIDTPTLVIGTCNVYNNKSMLKAHHHELNEYYIITSGTGYVYKNDKWIPAKKDDVFEFTAGEKHLCEPDTEEGLSFIYVFQKGPFNGIKYYFGNSKL